MPTISRAPISPERLLGAVLAGGRSSRFGSDKALAEWRGRPLLDRAIDALAGQCVAVVVCGRETARVATIADRPMAGLGPLGGLAAALRYADANGFDAVLSAPCDVPLLPDDLADRLRPAPAYLEALPVIGLWPVGFAAALDTFMATDARRSVRAFAAVIGARPVALPRPLVNVNHPDDLAAFDRSRPSF